ncbi:MAG: Clp protease N-terminal domain-containing protein [Candidatus Dormibacteraceae bacterium]
MYPFERFNEDAKKSLTLAQEEAERSHHSYIGTEHLLLGLLRVQKGTAYRVLTGLGVDIVTVRGVIKSVLGRNERILIQSIIPTSRVKKVIELSFEEARRMGDNEVDTAHMLLGLIIEGEGIAAHVLTDLGATLEKVRPAIERSRSTPAPERPPDHPATPGGEPVRHHADATTLLALLSRPRIAKLLKAKGVDTDALSEQLANPPPIVGDLSARLTVAHHSLRSAVEHQDFEVAARLRDEITDLGNMLARAEQEWLDSLT